MTHAVKKTYSFKQTGAGKCKTRFYFHGVKNCFRPENPSEKRIIAISSGSTRIRPFRLSEKNDMPTMRNLSTNLSTRKNTR
ncbi:MAG: hypothetical protein LBG96_03875 [Tannerella sp.]|nr:hypothetical protein [Tannerella sp.]